MNDLDLKKVAGAFMALALCGPLLAAEPSRSKPDPQVTDALSRGRVHFRAGDLNEARNEFKGVLKAHPDEPMALEYLGKIDAEFRKRVEKLLKKAEDAREDADELLARVLDGQPNDADGMKTLVQIVRETAQEEKIPLSDLEWYMQRPSTAPYTGARAEKLSKLKTHLKTRN